MLSNQCPKKENDILLKLDCVFKYIVSISNRNVVAELKI